MSSNTSNNKRKIDDLSKSEREEKIQELKEIISQQKKQISTLQKEEKENTDALNDLIKQKFEDSDKSFFTITCSPSKSNHVAHSKGIFSSEKKARSYIPKSRESHDDDDNCTWYYGVGCLEAKNISNLSDKLDKPPYRFPY